MIYATSDWHLGHYNIMKYEPSRPQTLSEMHEKLFSMWEGTVKSDDVVYFLGDLAFGNTFDKKRVQELPGKRIATPGNHDRKRSIGWWNDLGFSVVKEFDVRDAMFLNHYPPNNHDPRYSGILTRLRHEFKEGGGSVWVHGHVHSRTGPKIQSHSEIGYDFKVINVCPEANDFKMVLL